ncbi:MAG: class I SAM-dependent methyltransferase [Elusimicrobia bacterium]|nr:class I SAM-dependent methyltransferase [Elusimicrobiota bacterium]
MTAKASSSRVETGTWLQTYSSEFEIERRRKQLRWKLKKLGLDEQPRSVALLDMCCGHGEALDVMYEMGFRNLTGMDIAFDKRLSEDSRFRYSVGDALKSGFESQSFDIVTCIHAMHHFATFENVQKFLDEALRLLKPGGKLFIVDFENSPQIRLAFWLFRMNNFWFGNQYLRNYSQIAKEEWPFLKDYFPQWKNIENALYRGRLRFLRRSYTLFHFYLTLEKPQSIL